MTEQHESSELAVFTTRRTEHRISPTQLDKVSSGEAAAEPHNFVRIRIKGSTPVDLEELSRKNDTYRSVLDFAAGATVVIGIVAGAVLLQEGKEEQPDTLASKAANIAAEKIGVMDDPLAEALYFEMKSHTNEAAVGLAVLGVVVLSQAMQGAKRYRNTLRRIIDKIESGEITPDETPSSRGR